MTRSFEQAAKDVNTDGHLTSKPSDNELLELYALFKIAKGEDISKATKPGMFDLKGKAKYNAWDKEVKAGTSKKDAETKYVKLVEDLEAKYGKK